MQSMGSGEGTTRSHLFSDYYSKKMDSGRPCQVTEKINSVLAILIKFKSAQKFLLISLGSSCNGLFHLRLNSCDK